MLKMWIKTGLGVALLILGGCLILAQASEISPDDKSVLVFRIGVSRYRGSGQFYQGEPIWVSVGVRRKDSNDIPILQIGSKEIPWYRDVSFNVYKLRESLTEKTPSESQGTTKLTAEDTEKAKKSVGDVNETKKKILLNDIHVKLVQLLSRKQKKELKVNEIVRSSWAIDPNLTSKLSPGEYVIQAIYDTTRIRRSHPDIPNEYRSNELIIVINEPKDDNARAEVLSAQAKYFGRHQKHANERELLRHALALNPAKKELHNDLARSYELSGDINNAIKEYRMYVEWVRSLQLPRTGKNDINDHADIIEQMVKILEQKRAKEKEKAN